MSVTSRSARKSRPTHCSRRPSAPLLPPKSNGQFKTELNKAEEIEASRPTFVLHHEPPLLNCEECRLSLRERASREICSRFNKLVSQSIKAEERGVGRDRVPRAPMVAPSQLSPLGSADNSASTSSQSASPTTSGSPVTAADLANSFYRRPNTMGYRTPLYHPRPTVSMSAGHIPWMETRPSIFATLHSQAGRTQPLSPFNFCQPSPIAPPSGAMMAKITVAGVHASADASSGRIYTKDLVEEDEDVKILTWERILRTDIKPRISQGNGAFRLDAEVDYDRAEMTWLAEDGFLYTSPMMATEILPTNEGAQFTFSSHAVSAPARRSSPVPASVLPPGLVTLASNNRDCSSLYGDDDSILELLVQEIEPDDSVLDIGSVPSNRLPNWVW